MKKNELIKIWVLSCMAFIAYIPAFIWMWDRWFEADTYYSHGILIPFISGFLVWLKRSRLKQLRLQPSSIGWAFFVLGIIAHFISSSLRVYFTSGFSLLLVLAGLILLFLGKRYLRELAFPLGFLSFMIPLPLVVIANISFKLKIFAAHISTFIINSLSIPAVRDGSVIKTMHSYLIVEDPCSGIRSLIALIALGALLGHLSNLSRVKKAILFFSSIPIALASNVIRIVLLSLVSEMYGAKVATGLFHNVMGILVFVFAFIGLSVVGKLLE